MTFQSFLWYFFSLWWINAVEAKLRWKFEMTRFRAQRVLKYPPDITAVSSGNLRRCWMQMKFMRHWPSQKNITLEAYSTQTLIACKNLLLEQVCRLLYADSENPRTVAEATAAAVTWYLDCSSRDRTIGTSWFVKYWKESYCAYQRQRHTAYLCGICYVSLKALISGRPSYARSPEHEQPWTWLRSSDYGGVVFPFWFHIVVFPNDVGFSTF